MPVLGVIPARLGSTRLPRKPLQPLGGVPLIVRVALHVRGLRCADALVVASDSPEVLEVVEGAGLRGLLTAGTHASGTDRVAEVARRPEFAAFDIVLNVQGDEPFLPRAAVEGALARVRSGDDVGSAAAPLDPTAAEDPARVKVVFDAAGRALYFSRARIPCRRLEEVPSGRDGGGAGGGGDFGAGLYWQHLGVYACRRDALFRWVAAPPTHLEQVERLEQLRALELGLTIGIARLAEPAPAGIDTPEDLRRADAHWHQLHEVHA